MLGLKKSNNDLALRQFTVLHDVFYDSHSQLGLETILKIRIEQFYTMSPNFSSDSERWFVCFTILVLQMSGGELMYSAREKCENRTLSKKLVAGLQHQIILAASTKQTNVSGNQNFE